MPKKAPKTLSKNGKPLGRPITREHKPTLEEQTGLDLKQFIQKKSAKAENQEEKNQLSMKSSIGNIQSLKNCDPSVVSQFLKESYLLSKQPLVTSDDECIERLDWYFESCFEQRRIPCVEDMALALGVIRQTLNEWEHGKVGPRRADIVKKAKALLSSIDAKLVASGELNPVTYIFRSKNYYGMVDKTEIEHQVGNPYGEESQTQEQLQEKYSKSLPED